MEYSSFPVEYLDYHVKTMEVKGKHSNSGLFIDSKISTSVFDFKITLYNQQLFNNDSKSFYNHYIYIVQVNVSKRSKQRESYSDIVIATTNANL